MAHDVFISHSSANKATADAICHSLEASGVRCWIAPRDIQPGAQYGKQITRGIRECLVFLLVFSDEVNHSLAVQKELERAALGYRKIIIPFRIEDVPMNDNIEFFLGDVHWIDAYPNDSVFSNLIVAVKQSLGMATEGTFHISAQSVPAPTIPASMPTPAPVPITMPIPAGLTLPLTASPEVSFQPLGMAEIKTSSGNTYRSPANCLLTRSWDRIFTGISNDYNNVNLHSFDTMTKLNVSLLNELSFAKSTLAINWIDINGTPHSMEGDGGQISFHCLNQGAGVTIRLNDLSSVVFEHQATPPEVPLLRVYCKDGTQLVMPRGLFFMGHRVRPEPNATSWISGKEWVTSFITERSQNIDFSSLASVRILDAQLESDRFYNKWVVSSQLEFTLRNGRKMLSRLGTDSADFFGIDDFGTLELSLDEIAFIDFMETN